MADEARVLAVDLAARFSAAAVVVSPEPEVFKVEWQADSTGAVDCDGALRVVEVIPGRETQWIMQLEEMSRRYVFYDVRVVKGAALGAVAVEDQPHGVRFDSTAKHVARIQGRLIDRFDRANKLDLLWFVPPALWQRTIDGVWRKGPTEQLEAASKLGYRPPEFGPSLKPGTGVPPLGTARAIARKIQTDYVAAFLIGVWACRTLREVGSLDVPSCQSYAPAGHGEVRENG